MCIKYHGTPIGGPRLATSGFLQKNNRHALIPFFRQDDLGAALSFCTTVVFDTGAYTLFRQGGGNYDLHYDAYLDWVRDYYRHPRFAWAIIPDVIDGGEDENDSYLKRWPDDLKYVGVPVWHMNESLERLHRLCSNYPRVALAQGGYKGQFIPRLDEAMERICDENGQPICKLHGLKMQDPKIFTQYPFSSTDSTNIGQNNSRAFAQKKQPTIEQCSDYLANWIEIHNSAPSWSKASTKQLDFFE